MPKLPFSPRKMFSLVGQVSSEAQATSRLLIAGSDGEAMERVREELTRDADPGAAGYMVDTALLSEGNGSIPASHMENASVLILLAGKRRFARVVFG